MDPSPHSHPFLGGSPFFACMMQVSTFGRKITSVFSIFKKRSKDFKDCSSSRPPKPRISLNKSATKVKQSAHTHTCSNPRFAKNKCYTNGYFVLSCLVAVRKHNLVPTNHHESTIYLLWLTCLPVLPRHVVTPHMHHIATTCRCPTRKTERENYTEREKRGVRRVWWQGPWWLQQVKFVVADFDAISSHDFIGQDGANRPVRASGIGTDVIRCQGRTINLFLRNGT